MSRLQRLAADAAVLLLGLTEVMNLYSNLPMDQLLKNPQNKETTTIVLIREIQGLVFFGGFLSK